MMDTNSAFLSAKFIKKGVPLTLHDTVRVVNAQIQDHVMMHRRDCEEIENGCKLSPSRC